MIWAGRNSIIRIGENCLTGPGVTIITAQYDVKGRGLVRSYEELEKDVTIGNDVWLGANCVILPGVTLGDGVIVGAGAVVTGDAEAYSVLAGVPAKKIKSRTEYSV